MVADSVFSPGPSPKTVRTSDGTIVEVPDGWVLVRPGDAALTRRIKNAGQYWLVQEIKRRKIFSRGLWAPQETVQSLTEQLATERASPVFFRSKEKSAARRVRIQAEYVQEFFDAVVSALNFHPKYFELAEKLARAITDHATPVGSGTVARTQRIPIHERADAAIIAWMRHHTTEYDDMVIPKIKGKRREVRRLLAKRSTEVLTGYRLGALVHNCPLERALQRIRTDNEVCKD